MFGEKGDFIHCYTLKELSNRSRQRLENKSENERIKDKARAGHDDLINMMLIPGI